MQGSSSQQTRYIFVTGGVVSSLGKGIAAASLGRLLVERGLRVEFFCRMAMAGAMPRQACDSSAACAAW